MIATAVTLAILWFVGTVLGELVRQNRDKILSALQGRSLLLQPEAPSRPATVRFSPLHRAAEPVRPALRAAA
jgi:hypothetical protein